MMRRGFTLIEIMIALLIFAIMATIAATGLTSVLKTHDRISKNTDRLAQLQLAMTIISRDFSQMVNRPIADNQGNRITAVITSKNYIEFTKAGYANPEMLLPRSTLQRVAYEWKNNQLLRITWPVLDRAPDTQAESRVLIDNVTGFQLRYLSAQNTFYDSWPPAQIQDQLLLNPLPKAVEMTLTLQNWGSMQQILLIASPSGDTE